MTRGRPEEGEYIHTTINMSTDLYDWISEQMAKKNISSRTRVIEDALRDYISIVDGDPLTQMLKCSLDWCSKSSCKECPIQNSCAKYLKSESLASFALEGMMDISNRSKKMVRGE